MEVQNTGMVAGEEVVELYMKGAGPRSLAGFQRVALRPGETRTVRFTLSARQLAGVGPDGRHISKPGPVTLWIAGKQPEPGAAGVTMRIEGPPQEVH